MLFWKVAPLSRLMMPFIAGIVLEFYFPVPGHWNETIFLICLIAIAVSLILSPNQLLACSRIIGIIILLAFVCLGRFISRSTGASLISGRSSLSDSIFAAILTSNPVQKNGSYRSTATIHYGCSGISCYREDKKIVVHFRDSLLSPQIEQGVWIIFRKRIYPIQNTGEGSFDYVHYCRLKQIQGQVFLKSSDYSLSKYREKSFQSALLYWRKKIIRIIRQYVPGKEESGLLEALLVGFTEDLDRSVVQSYADTGVVHIIAISGLHLALIYQILQFFLSRINRSKGEKWIRMVVLMLALWLFSLLSGASPSVLRSAVMFSLVLTGNHFSRQANGYNSLAASCFLMLCFNPYWLWDAGFQLSYAAVFGIFAFLSPIQNLVHPKNKILSGLWQAASISIAAQITTMPISLYYFHRFPTYFLLTNIPVVPFSSLILAAGIALCICSVWAPLAGLLGLALGTAIKWLNAFIAYTARLPGAICENLQVGLMQVILLYILIYLISHYLRVRTKAINRL